ncbi:MAG: T9SS type A sorting domain-containing protein [Bacteroidota bacterium]
MQKTTILTLLFCLFVHLGLTQDARIAQGTTSTEKVPRYTLPTLNNAELLAAEMARRGPGIAPRYAQSMTVDITPASHGSWETVNGQAIWRLRIFSSKAKSLNLGFTSYYMPTGGSLILYSPDQQVVRGPFTPADNEDHGQLWTPVLEGEELVIEVQVPQAEQQNLLLHLTTVNHDFLGFAQALSGSCNLDVICGANDGWPIVDGFRDIIQSVGVYGTGGGTFCTGFLVNNTAQDCKPFFMTANHCGISPGNAPSIVVYWNFQNSTCRQPNSGASGGNGDGQLNQFNTGSIHRASWANTDFTLLELDDDVDETYEPFMAGWDATSATGADSVIAIHHPSTDEKRISFEFDPTNIGTANGNANPNGNFVVVNDWDIGTTEGGSSGSPLFNKEKRVIGQLFGGAAACNNNLYDSYGWFHRSWTGGGTPSTRLSDWLDPTNSGQLTMDGRSCGITVYPTPSAQTICASSNVVYNLEVSSAFSAPVQMVLTGVPNNVNATFSQNPAAPGSQVSLTISNTGAASGNYVLGLFYNDGTSSGSTDLDLAISDMLPISAALLTPTDAFVGTATLPSLTWDAEATSSYEVQVATDPAFANIVDQTNGVITGSYQVLTTLDEESLYYWRAKGTNGCGEGPWSQTSTFTTGALFCGGGAASVDVPKAISSNGTNTISSSIVITDQGVASGIRLKNVDISHTFTGDLTMTLESPLGTQVIISERTFCSNDDLLVGFDDDASLPYSSYANACSPFPPAASGTFRPANPLSEFVGENINGTWRLIVNDLEDEDGGFLNGWELEICSINTSALEVRSDSIQVCAGDDAAFDVLIGDAFAGNATVAVTASGVPAGASLNFNPVLGSPNSVVAGNITGLNTAGTYNIDITALNNIASRTQSLVIEVASPPVAASLINPTNNTVNLGPQPSLNWLGNGGNDPFTIEVALDDQFSNIVQTTSVSSLNTWTPDSLDFGQRYYWRVVVQNACGTETSETWTFGTGFRVGIGDLLNGDIKLYPNPGKDIFNLEMEQPLSADAQVQLVSLDGKVIYQNRLTAGSSRYEIDLRQQASGLYLLRLSTGDASWTQKLMIQ